MLSRDRILNRIRHTFECRKNDDYDGAEADWALDATYRLACQPGIVPYFPAEATPAREVMGALMDTFKFHEVELLDQLIDGDHAATRWKAKVSYGSDPKNAVWTEISQLWTFDAEGKVASLTEFADTALINAIVAAGKNPIPL